MMVGRVGVLALLVLTAAPVAAVPPYPGHGCWVQLFDGPDYDTPTVRIEGPAFFEDTERQAVVERELRAVGGQNFVDRVHSVIVGPRATAELFEQQEFTGRSLRLGPGDRVADLGAFEIGDSIASIRIRCSFDEGEEVLDTPTAPAD